MQVGITLGAFRNWLAKLRHTNLTYQLKTQDVKTGRQTLNESIAEQGGHENDT